MASLVADYSSDSEDETPQEEAVSDIKIKEEIQEEEDIPSAPSNFFTTSDNVSDDECEAKSVKTETNLPAVKQEKPAKAVSKLPSLSEINPGTNSSSVFVNPFDKAEQAKNQILEKHVRLTEAAPQKPAHQPVCWKFKKGKCHMGKNCRFFHAVDNLSIDNGGVTPATNNNNNNNVNLSSYHPAAYLDAHRRPLEEEPADEDSYMAQAKKKRRVGVNDRLLPPKKAMDSLMAIRRKERPWTLPGASS